LTFLALISSLGVSQTGIITTYVGPQLPVNGDWATTPDIGKSLSVASDGAGGFYFISQVQSQISQVYRVTADGRLSFVAGNGTSGFSGDGGPATSAQLSSAYGIAIDTAGNLFIADTANARIRKVTPSGVISTVAGNGTQGYGGDGGPATSALLSDPLGVAVDTAGNLFIADMDNARIRKVTPDGLMSTVAGNGTQGLGGDDGPATSAQFFYPQGVAVDATGNLFIADTANSRIRKVTPGGLISTVAGTSQGYSGDGGPATSAQINYPKGVAVDAAGNLFIADNERIRKVTPDGLISTVAGNGTSGYSGDGGPAISAQFWGLICVAVDAAGNLFIADQMNARIRKVTPDGVISTVAGNGTYGYSGDGGPATSAQIYNPLGVTVDTAGNLFFADNGNGRVRKVTPGGMINTVAGNGIQGFSGDGGPATSAQFYELFGIAVDAAGNLFLTDTYNARIRKVTPDGVISTVAGEGTPGYSGDSGPATSAQLYWPYGVAVDTSGNLFIADTGNACIRKVTPDGVISTVAGNGIQGFGGDGRAATLAQFHYPYGIAVDTAGNLFIADMYNARIRKVTPSGRISTVAGNGIQGYGGDGGPATSAELNYPSGVAVDTAGNLFIADQMNSRIRKVMPGGLISTVAGNGFGFGGDGGPATSALFASPYGVAVDTAGNLFISDSENERIRKVTNIAVCSSLVLGAGGTATCQTIGETETTQVGYAKFGVNSGTTPYGTAVFSSKQNGVTVTEAGVPASLPTTQARVFIDYRSNVNAIPARSNAGMVNVNTGIAVENNGSVTANVTYTLSDLNGDALITGHGTLTAGEHFAKFVDQLKDVAPDFSMPTNFQFGSLEIISDQPISVLAMRGTTNQRNEFLVSTTPTADLTQTLSYSSVYFPQLADGGGNTTSLILLNTSNGTESGTLQILGNNGLPLVVDQVGGMANSIFRYSIPSGGALRFQTDGSPAAVNVGWVQLTPDSFSPTPIAFGVFSYNPVNVMVSESGIPATASTTHARIYVDLSGNHDVGLAVANVNAAAANITINAYQTDGATSIGTSQGPLQLAAGGHNAQFADQLISGLPAGFTGVLDISSTTPFAAVTVRSLTNERGDFLMTTFPVADLNQAAPSPIVFPQIADGGGYITEFILISSGQAASTTLNYYDENGSPTAY
jgi:sugar lactone lactonase YvrE